MRAYFLTRPGALEMQNVPQPEPGEGEVVLRIRAALTCGTDIKTFLRGHPKFPMPMPFGHEFSGDVAKAGRGVTTVREGDAVMATPTAPCGECYFCLREQENLCDTVMPTMVHGAYGEYVKLPARVVRTNLYRKPPGVSYGLAALLEPLSCVMHGLSLAPVRQDDRVVLIGAGAISLLHLLALRARGVLDVTVIGRTARRLHNAADLGAARVFRGTIEAARNEILALTQGRGADVVIECTGQAEVWEGAPHLVRRGGTVVFFGGCPPGTVVRLDTQRVHYDQLRLISPFHFTPRAVQAAHQLLIRPDFNGEALISGRYPLEALPAALAAHRAGEGIKFLIEPST